jgi:hypothetical protein
MKQRLLAPAILLAICVGFYWRLTLSGQYTWLDGNDLAYQVLPWYQFQAGEWSAGRPPLWDPYHWAGQPLIGQAQPGAAYPPNWLLFLLPPRNGWIRHTHLNWYFVLIHWQAMLFAYLLCRDVKCSRAASMFGGVVFGLGGYMGVIDWPQMLNGAAWAPLVVLFALRIARGERVLASGVFAGTFLGISLLSGHHQAPVFVALIAGGLCLWRFLSAPSRRLRTALATLLLGVFAALCGGLQVLPAIEYGRLSVRWVGVTDPVGWGEKVPYLVHSQFSASIAGVFGLVISGFQTHLGLFSGVVAVALATVAVMRTWSDVSTRALAAGAALALVFTWGNYTFLHGLLYSLIPWVEKARTPQMAGIAVNVLLAPLAAMGLERALDASGDWARRVSRALAIFGAALLLLTVGLALGAGRPVDSNSSFAVAAVAAMLLAALLAGRAGGHLSARALTTAVFVIALVELSGLTAFSFAAVTDENATKAVAGLARTGGVAEFLRSGELPARVDVSNEDVPQNFGDFVGLESAAGYLASLTRNVHVLQSHDPRMRELLGVRWVVASKPPVEGQAPLFEDPNGLKVYERQGTLPRVWTVHQAGRFASAAEIAGKIRGGEIDPRATAPMLSDPPPLERCEGDAARLVEWTPGRVVIAASMVCRGMLVLAETWFPGWVAEVDGAPAEIHEVYAALRGVVLNEGSHLVEMRYRPRSVLWGGLMTLAGLVLAIGVSIAGRR